MMGMTQRQKQVYDLIVQRADNGLLMPSHDEICAAVGLKSKAIANHILVALEERGLIARMPRKDRAIELLPTDGVVPVDRETRAMIDALRGDLSASAFVKLCVLFRLQQWNRNHVAT